MSLRKKYTKMALNNVHKALAGLVEETALNTIEKLTAFLSEKIEFDDDMKTLFEEFKKNTKDEIKASFKNDRNRKGGAKEEKKKREPSPYNLFIKEKMAEIKAKKPELKGKELMKEAIEEWKKKGK